MRTGPILLWEKIIILTLGKQLWFLFLSVLTVHRPFVRLVLSILTFKVVIPSTRHCQTLSVLVTFVVMTVNAIFRADPGPVSVAVSLV